MTKYLPVSGYGMVKSGAGTLFESVEEGCAAIKSKAAQRETHHCSKLCGVCMVLLEEERVFFFFQVICSRAS